jgi:AP-4 complex subunit beta-1
MNYAERNQELAILAINTFLMDCNSANYKIRGLALRTLCSLRFEGVSDYIQQAIQNGIRDPDPYVKKTAIIGIVKLYRINRPAVMQSEFVETLYKLLRDGDSQVVSNAILALNEILEDDGGISISRKLIIYLLNRFHEFNEWGQTLVLDMIQRYSPRDDNEMLDILNILEERLSKSSASVLLGCTKIFIHYTKHSPDINKQVLQRLQGI